MSAGDPVRQRIERVTRILREAGFPDVLVAAEGQEREIAAVRVPPADWDRLAGPDGARVADEVKAAGFRYVALDLLPSEASSHSPAESAGESTDALADEPATKRSADASVPGSGPEA